MKDDLSLSCNLTNIFHISGHQHMKLSASYHINLDTVVNSKYRMSPSLGPDA